MSLFASLVAKFRHERARGAMTDNELARHLGAALRAARVARGLSLRALAARLHLSGHGTLVDYEHGRRIPPADLLLACEDALQVTDGHLRALREQALAQRAGQQAAVLLAERPTPPSSDRRTITLPLPTRAGWIVIVIVAVLVAGLSLAFARSSAASGPAVRVGFERPTDDWVTLYGSQVAQARTTGSMAFEGTHSLLMTVTGASASRGYSAVGTTHGIADVRPGTKITFHLWVPGPQAGGVRFFVQDSHFRPVWAPETGDTEVHLPVTAGWSTVTWTVPRADRVHTIGMQVWSEYDTPILVGLDAISW